jgi:putative DNA primase/helicase
MWHIWNGVRWEPDRTTQVFEMSASASSSGSRTRTAAATTQAPAADARLRPQVAVLKTLASMPGIAMTGEEWDRHPELMGFKNGVLDLRTLKLDITRTRRLLISRSTGVDWDPNADFDPFYDFVDDIMSNDPDLTDYLLRVLGYSMIGTNREQKFWMWVGQGQNGKGVLARVVAQALGDYAATPPDTLYMRTRTAPPSDKPRPELLKLEGARFTYMSEPQGKQFNEEMLKAHTGNDFIEARTLHSKTFKTFQPTHKIIFLTNNPPRTDDVGPSMQRRVRIVWFEQDYRPEERRQGAGGSPEGAQEPSGRAPLMAQGRQLYLMTACPSPRR